MRHKAHRNRLIQKPDHARMIQRNLVTSLFLYEEIRTTRRRARVIQPLVDGLITTAKKRSPHIAIRSINAFVTDKNASRKLMEVLKPRYANRQSGFTSLKAVGARVGDGAELVDLVLMDRDTTVAPAAAKVSKKAGLRPAKPVTTQESPAS
jgi:large subunit ribosomal protein L17